MRGVACAVLLLVATAGAAAPAHYLVLERAADGRIRTLLRRTVELADATETMDPRALLPGKRSLDGGATVHLRGIEGTRVRTAQVLQLDRDIRAEAVDAKGELIALPARSAPQTFVVRAPLSVQSLRFDDGYAVQDVDLRRPASPKSDAHGFDAFAQAEVIRKDAGPPGNRVDLLLVAEGFTEAERADFDAIADKVERGFFARSPYREYRTMVNVSRLFVASRESGADHPAYRETCTDATCCTDIAARDDPRAGWQRDTAFDARFCTLQQHRLLTVDPRKVFAAAAAVPDWDRIVVVVNDPGYGGSGGSIATLSSHTSAIPLAAHEYGHSFTRLADEYTTAYPGYPACSDSGGLLPGCEANATDQTLRSAIKWRNWIAPQTPVPSPGATPGIGLFEGARYQASGMYRPADRCLMNRLEHGQFCAVCREHYVTTLYRGGFGAPAQGIDLIEPGSESPSPRALVRFRIGQSLRFSADVLRPDQTPVDLQWWLDGELIPGATKSRIDLGKHVVSPGLHTLELRAIDRGAVLHASNIAIATHARAWRVMVLEQFQ